LLINIIGVITGAVLLIAALFILGFGKNEIDHVTDQIVMKVPILGTIKTRQPLVAIAFAGFALLIVFGRMAQSADQAQRQDESITVDGTINSPNGATVFFVAYPKGQYSQLRSGPLQTLIPKITNMDYRAEFVVNGTVVAEQPLNVVNGHADLSEFDSQGAPQNLNVVPQIGASDAASANFLKR
jgi:hypothetical protein